MDKRSVKSGAKDLIQPLGGRGERLLAANLMDGEEVYAKLPGNGGQALVLTNKRLYIVKWGFMAGQTFGGKCIAYEYRNITALEIKKHLLTSLVQVLTPATRDNNRLSYWNTRSKDQNNARESDSAVTFNASSVPAFQEAVNLGRHIISQMHEGVHSARQEDSLDKLEKLATLRQKGVITEVEFQTKKKQLLEL